MVSLVLEHEWTLHGVNGTTYLGITARTCIYKYTTLSVREWLATDKQHHVAMSL